MFIRNNDWIVCAPLNSLRYLRAKVKMNGERPVGMRRAMALVNEATGEFKQLAVYKEAL